MSGSKPDLRAKYTAADAADNCAQSLLSTPALSASSLSARFLRRPLRRLPPPAPSAPSQQPSAGFSLYSFISVANSTSANLDRDRTKSVYGN